MKVITFHGFLGDAKQFQFLEDDSLIHFPFEEFIHLDIAAIINHIEQLLSGEQATLIGYSFGARLAMQIFIKRPDLFNQLILLGGHAGLKTELEKSERFKIEENFINQLESRDDSDFILWWNNLDLFNGDLPLNVERLNRDVLKLYFSHWGLSKQPYLLEDLKMFKDQIFWFFGELDTKYCAYAKKDLNDFNVNFIPQQGHRVFQSSLAQNLIKERLWI